MGDDWDFRVGAPLGWRELPDAALVNAALAEVWNWPALRDQPDDFRRQMTSLTPGQRTVAITGWVDVAVQAGGFLALARPSHEHWPGVGAADITAAFAHLGMAGAAANLEGEVPLPAPALRQSAYRARARHVWSTPVRYSPSSGLLALISIAWFRTSRVSSGSMIASSHSLAAP
jgi:hypothetical protein